MTVDEAVEKYYNSVFSYIYGRSDKDKNFSDECCNTVFFLFSLKEKKIEDGIVYPWLIRTANNKLKEYRRIKEKDSVVLYLEDLPYTPADHRELSDVMIGEEEIEEAAKRLIAALSPEDRQMYEDYFIHKLSFIEIAERLGIDRNTASKRVQKLKKKLEEDAGRMFGIGGAYTVLRIIAFLFDR